MRLLVFLLLSAAGVHAQAPLRLDASHDEAALDGHLDWLADPDAAFTLGDIRGDRAADFVAVGPVLSRDQMRPEVFWLRLTVQAPDGAPTTWALETTAERAEVFWVGPEGRVEARVAGIDVPKAERSVDLGFPATVLLDLDSGETRTVWARVLHDPDGSEATPQMHVFHLKPAAAAARDNRVLGVSNGLFFGFLLALALYNLSLYVGFRDVSFLYYVGNVVGLMVYFATTYRLLYDALWPAEVGWSPLLQTLAAHAAPAFYALFVRHFLGPERLGRMLDRLLLAVAGLLALGLGVTALGGWLVGSFWNATLILALCVLSLAGMVRAWRVGFAPAGLLLVSFGVLALSTVGFLGPRFGMPRIEWAMEVLQAGVAFEALLLALALTARVRDLRSAQTKALTESRRMQEANAALQQAAQLRTNLLGFAAHDLRSPLSNVLGFAEMIQSDAADRPQIASHGQAIETSAARLLQLVDDLLVTAALDGGHVRLAPEPTDLGALVEEATQPFALLAEAKGIRLETHTPRGIAARVDPDRFHEVVDNLVSNAVKYTPPGGLVEVEVRGTDRQAWLCVSDSGPGLTTQDRDMLFQPFTRLSARPTASEPSTGLGLAIVKQLVDLHGGRVVVDSEPGRGARFTVVLPAVGAPAPAPADETAAREG